MIVILNAPPATGKDTIGGILADWHGWKALSFKKPMFDLANSLLGEDKYAQFLELYNDRSTKDKPTSICGGLSPRDFFIHISEKMCKPLFGEQYFGERFLELVSNEVTTVVTDGGFHQEVRPMLDAGHRVVIVRLFRKGYDFSNDSRRYLTEQDFSGLPTFRSPSFLDVELIEGQPYRAADYIFNKLEG